MSERRAPPNLFVGDRLQGENRIVRKRVLELLDEMSAPMHSREIERALCRAGFTRSQARPLVSILKRLSDYRHRRRSAVTLPRALSGRVLVMARPSRPAEEVRAVREAAAAIRDSTCLASARALGREIADRVTAAMLDDAQNDPAAILPGLTRDDPIAVLAYAPGLAADELAERFRDRMLANFGIAIPAAFQQEVQRRDAARELRVTLVERYARHLRNLP